MNNSVHDQPELLVNHTWQIEISRGLDDNVDASRPSQLKKGNRIRIEKGNGSDNVRFLIWTADDHRPDKPDYELDGVLTDHEELSSSMWRKAVIEFEDTACGGSKIRILTITAVRLKAGHNNGKGECTRFLEDNAEFITDPGKRQLACKNDDLIIWKVEDKFPPPHTDPPEPGQGTASGKVD